MNLRMSKQPIDKEGFTKEARVNNMGFLFFSNSATIDRNLCSLGLKDLLDSPKSIGELWPTESGRLTGDSKSVVREDVRVQVPLPALAS